MRKKTKRLLSFMTAAAMSVSAFAGLSLSASAEGENVFALYKAAESDIAATLIKATYNDGVLVNAAVSSAAITAGATEYEVADAEEGATYYLWDMTDGKQTPLADSLKVEGGEPTPTDPAETDNPAPTDPVETENPAPTDTPTPTPSTDVTPNPNAILFDFGAEGSTPEAGYTLVTPDRNYTVDGEYGFIGNNENDWRLEGGRIDGFVQQEGQVIELTAGGGTGLLDGIGSTGEDIFGNAGDKYYPVRFALKADDETYWKVKATVTTLDPTKDATASLYTERKHPLYTEKVIKAGESVTTEWTVRVTPIYYEKSDPKGTAADGMVNVALLGENTALAALEFEQVDSAPTLWYIGDSTGTDGGGTLPFWPLQNYTGVGTGITKYLPGDIALVNVGEGGLNATDNNHFNIAKNRIKEGDYMWVQYGHNHKTGGTDEYTAALDKYYEACKAVGATLILVGPIDRINTYDSATNTWSSSLSGFEDAAKAYVDAKLAADPTDKIGFFDLNRASLEWYEERTASGIVNDQEVTNEAKLVYFYFQAPRGAKDVDHTHPNDMGAENLAYLFFEQADDTTYPALAPLLTRIKDGTAETPTLVSPDIINLGYPANDSWPLYQTIVYPYPIVINDVVINENNQFESIDAEVVDQFANYASGVLEIIGADGEVVSTHVTIDHIDNTTGNGVNTLHFSTDNPPTLEEGQSYRIYMWSCRLDREELLPEEEGGERLSAIYEPTDVDAYLLPGESGNVETFSYYGKDNLNGAGEWVYGGSNGSDLALGTDGDRTYATIAALGTGNSFFLRRPLENLDGGTGTSGTYLVDVDLKYMSGSGMSVRLSEGWSSSSPFVTGTGITLFDVGSDGKVTVNGTEAGQLTLATWTNLRYTLDMDNGIATISVGGSDPITVDIPAYQTMQPTIKSQNNFIVTTASNGGSFNVQWSNLTVAKLKTAALPDVTIEAVSADDAMGSVYIGEEGTTSVTVTQNETVTLTAVPAEGYLISQWEDEDGNALGFTNELTIRAYRSAAIKAVFEKEEVDPITYLFKEDFRQLTTESLASNGWTSTNAQGNMTVENAADDYGNYLQFAPGNQNSRGMIKDFGLSGVTSDYVVEMDLALTAGNGQNTTFALINSAANNGINDSANSYIFALDTTNSTTWTINGGTETVEIPAGTWVHVTIIVNADGSSVNCTIANGDTTLYTGDITPVGGTDLKGIHLREGRYYGVTKMDNVRVYTADQLQ